MADDFPRAGLLVFPELHTVPAAGGTPEHLRAAAERLEGPWVEAMSGIARRHGIHLLPGSFCEAGPDGELFNTAVMFGPDGDILGTYRKIFPWRPSEPFTPGGAFTVVDVEGVRIGLSICYDAWFPEHSRQLGWLGADVIVNIVHTTTCDRTAEVVLAQANAITNQVYVVSVNSAGPEGVGRSLIVDPEGIVRTAAPAAERLMLTDVLDPAACRRVRRFGTSGLNRLWSQFTPADHPLTLPAYNGQIEPERWSINQKGD
ncbi:carbon-nitrogen hydrolase family protein [Raineyella fluvialis]|uniref:Carbon-nitrogen hydrolase family protein n=2 Tax=Raineyella fluvialis TaxID=2662261 RepID=A0A5Q2FLI2_9ACTN|nr:carbon-nitrogen hydrolase family protein [Raineyella fluvialis]